MQYESSPTRAPIGIQLNIAGRPLDAIIALAACIFVLNVVFEVVNTFGVSLSHMMLLLGLIGFLGCWALVECLLLTRHHLKQPFQLLKALLIAQIMLSMIRAGVLMTQDSPMSQSYWMLNQPSASWWHFLFILPYGLVFLAIQKNIADLFSLNQRIHAANKENQMLITLNAMAMARDNETGNHILRTQEYVRRLALRLRDMGHHTSILTDQFIDLIFKAAPLHDVGKVGIPDAILNKKGALTPDEWVIMKTHTTIGESILETAVDKLGRLDDVLDKAIMIASAHHERWDGSGYPRGLSGEAIPLAGRIMALADIYDALVSNRSYKVSWTHEQAAAEIRRISGSHLDPTVVLAFEVEQSRFQQIALELKD